MKIVIIAGGTPPSKKLLTKEIKNSYIIAADGGANCLWEYKIAPNCLIGDLDSIDKKALKFIKDKKTPIETFSSEKDFTDAELALKKALSFKPKEIIFLGAIGGNRADHFLGALGLLNKCLRKNTKCLLKDDNQTITLAKKPITIYGTPQEMFSLQAYGGSVKNLTITGSKYTLKNHSIKMGEGLTLSNEFRNKKVNINFKSGKLLTIRLNSKKI